MNKFITPQKSHAAQGGSQGNQTPVLKPLGLHGL